MNRRALLPFLICFLGAHAAAAEISETFDSRADLLSGTAVWNQALGKIHPTLRAMNFEAGFTPLDFSVGDGSDGSFDPLTYANFSVGGDVSGNIIRLDTAAHPVLQVTKFILAQGWSILPVGGAPLIIESLSTVQIHGEIHCEGEDAQNSLGLAIGAGGAGRCGGFSGGDGGLLGGPGADGTDTLGAVTGGRGGVFAGTFVGGGGGGSWSTASPPANGPNAVGASGHAGVSFSDPEFLIISGGAGGGGGSGDAAGAGGGGGGGGGVVIIHAVGDVDIGASPTSIFGFIFVSGGKGGNAGGGGGPGGGGGGGSVQVFSGGLVNLYNTDVNGASQAHSGIGGTNVGAAVGANGGIGRSWVSTSTFFTSGLGTYSPTEEFPVNSGNIEFNSATQNIITKVIDTANNYASVDSLILSPASNDFLFEIAGSSDGFILDDTGWTTNRNLVSGKRFLKMKLSITTSNVAAPDMIDTAIIAFSPTDNFTFQSAGCGRVDDSPFANLFFLFLAPLTLIILKIKAQRNPAR